MPDVAVVAHSGKSFGGGLRELRTVLAREGVTDPLWYEVKKSRHAPACARRAADHGADVIFVWGGDGGGFDARMISEAGRGMKDRLGRAAYLYTGIRNLSTRRV
jgi:diacylglycerol kinase family enzyme